jgi:hypothetical protein
MGRCPSLVIIGGFSFIETNNGWESGEIFLVHFPPGKITLEIK